MSKKVGMFLTVNIPFLSLMGVVLLLTADII